MATSATKDLLQTAVNLRARGKTLETIGFELGCSTATAQRWLQACADAGMTVRGYRRRVGDANDAHGGERSTPERSVHCPVDETLADIAAEAAADQGRRTRLQAAAEALSNYGDALDELFGHIEDSDEARAEVIDEIAELEWWADQWRTALRETLKERGIRLPKKLAPGGARRKGSQWST